MRYRLTSVLKSLRVSYSTLRNTIRFTKTEQVQGQIFERYSRTLRLTKHFSTPSTGLTLGIFGITKALCNSPENIVPPDPNTLTTENLLKNASFAVVESTCAFLSQVTTSYAESCEQYTKALYILMKLMEYRLKVLGHEENERKISDLILEARASVNKFRLRNQELQMLYMSAYNLVNEASTAAYSAGSEFHSTVATSLVQSSDIHLSKYRKELGEAETQLREMEANVINVESEHAEKQFKSKGKAENIDSCNEQKQEEESIETNTKVDSDFNDNENKF